MDRIPERLRTAAEGVEKATQMMADAKSKRNGDGACYSGLKREETAEWKAAEMIERYEAALAAIKGFGDVNLSGEWEHGLRDIIRSMTDCARTALGGADA